MTDLLSRALRVIPSGVLTFSKARSCWPAAAPTHIRRGRGAHVWADDGREFIDVTLALGAVTLGYQNPDVEASIDAQRAEGPLFSLEHPITVEVAERLTSLFPCSQKDGQAKFFKTGSDATTAAVRLARAHTGRDIILTSGYHGWDSWTAANRAGVPSGEHEAVVPFVFGGNNAEAAAVILEADTFDVGQLRAIRSYCDATDTLLVFDEVLTGFRQGPGGHQFLCGVTPDITTVSKALGNGYAIAAVIGPRDIMQTFEKVGVSGTFGGDTIGLAAARAVIAVSDQHDGGIYPYYKRLWDVGGKLREGFASAAREFGIDAEPEGYPPRWVAKFGGDVDVDPIIRDRPARLPWRTLWAQEMQSRGVLANFGMTACVAHGDSDVERILGADREAFRVLASVDRPEERLIGDAASPGVRAA